MKKYIRYIKYDCIYNLVVIHITYIFTQAIYILFINSDSLKGMQKKKYLLFFSTKGQTDFPG